METVPHLTTALTGPLLEIEALFLERQPRIEAWFREQWLHTPAPFYASVDLRNAGFKLAPVDTNLFPAGFNNLNPAFFPLCIQAVQIAMERVYPMARRVLLIPESHTRNLPYLESLAILRDILRKAGFEVGIGALSPVPSPIALPSGKVLEFLPLQRKGGKLVAGGFEPCVVLLNNDLAEGCPPLLKGLEQPVVPPLEGGWWHRLKSAHFHHYQKVAEAFAELVGIDPWLIAPMFRNCGAIDFMKREGEACLARYVGELLEAIREKYRRYGVDRRPFVIIKADAGTYGMGIMSVSDPREVEGLNRRQRTKMAFAKGGRHVQRVILQEGVYTFEDWDGAVAEPVVYLIDHYVVGGFYRVHTGRSPDENLNAPGMHFQPLAFASSCLEPSPDMSPDAQPNRFYAYGVIARLALLAAAREQTHGG
ncbi:MAG: glutamate--cysteine ligase [Gammaproteobacteria bacterium]|nr:MAG: glutamate--cysteine ligase [Gammaproteobacteria bacterium]